jgi:hypothetical protein
MKAPHGNEIRAAGRRRRLGADSGVAIAEFALVMPILAVLLFGMIEFGRAVNYWIDATHLANEAARWAVVDRNPGTSGQTLQQYVQAHANTAELRSGGTGALPSPLTVRICFPSGTQAVGEPVRATATFTYHWLPFIGSKISTVSTTIVGSATMRLEALPTQYTPDSSC